MGDLLASYGANPGGVLRDRAETNLQIGTRGAMSIDTFIKHLGTIVCAILCILGLYAIGRCDASRQAGLNNLNLEATMLRMWSKTNNKRNQYTRVARSLHLQAITLGSCVIGSPALLIRCRQA